MVEKKDKKKDSKSNSKKKNGNLFFGLFKFFVTIVLMAAVLVLFRNVIVKTALTKYLSARTGVDFQIDHLDISLRQPVIIIKDVKLFNPVGFEDEFMAYAPEVYVKYNPKGFLKRKFAFDRVTLNLQELYILKNTKGLVNIHALKALETKYKEGEVPVRRWSIDRFDLTLGQVTYKDYTKAGPLTKKFDVNMVERFDNLDPKGLIRVIVWKALTKTAIAKLINFDIVGLEKMISGSSIITAPVVVPQKIIEGTATTLKKAADGITDVIKKPFDKNTNTPK